MNIKEKKLAADMLEKASDEFSNHGCNDVENSVYKNWSLEERRQFVKEFHIWNGDPEEYNENFLNMHDYMIMGFLAYKLEHDTVKEKVEILQTKEELLECIQNLMGVFDTPISKRLIKSEFAEEVRKNGRNIIESNLKYENT